MLCWMRTTDRVDEPFPARARRHAAETGRTLTAVPEDALRKSRQRRVDAGERHPPIIVRRPCGETGAGGNLVQDANFAAPAAASHAAHIEVRQ
jgi:hypothetical protein